MTNFSRVICPRRLHFVKYKDEKRHSIIKVYTAKQYANKMEQYLNAPEKRHYVLLQNKLYH